MFLDVFILWRCDSDGPRYLVLRVFHCTAKPLSEKCLLNKSPANVILNWGGGLLLHGTMHRGALQRVSKEERSLVRSSCVYMEIQRRKMYENVVWTEGWWILARIKRTLVIHLYGKMRQECTQMFLVLKKSKKKGVCFSGRGGLSLGFQYFTCFTL